mmetsp:Transcript_31488/g.46455  ORF Transcript_31488/g.46455 Transcript_31488/m.46455 type:complete len:431 (+) Transcript_31488:77-1369(+)
MTSTPDNDRPFHVLMSSSHPHQELLKDRRLQSDYIARRFDALEGGRVQDDVWTAVSAIERALVECCELEEEDEEDDDSIDNVIINGALMTKKVIPFVELMARHCYKVNTRRLVLTILERTVEQDNLIRQQEEEESDEEADVKRPNKNCMSRFMAAGGLKIINQWLKDAVTPVKVSSLSSYHPATKKQKTSSSATTEMNESANGPLLVPLLKLLEGVPFNKSMIKDSGLNTTILDLKDSLSKQNLPKRSTHPKAGGYIVSQVVKAVDSLLASWKESRKDKDRPVAKDPTRQLHQTMSERLRILKEFEAGNIEKPDWLAQFEREERILKGRRDMKKLSPEERERRVQQERALEEIKRKREETGKKMEELKKKHSLQKKVSKLHKRVRWKDGKECGKIMEKMIEYYHYPPEIESSKYSSRSDNEFSDEEDLFS